MVDHITAIPLPGRTLVSHHDGMVAGGEAGIQLPNFVAGPENRLIAATFDRLLARAESSEAAIDRQPSLPAVLSLFGPSGVGKTHLSRGLVGYWLKCRGPASAEYLSAQDFRRQLNDAMNDNAVPDFRQRLRACELLAIDDLHQLRGDDYVLCELRFMLDALNENGAIVIFTSTRPVSALPNLTPELRSRLAAGLMLQLAPPGMAARVQIVQQVSSALGERLSDDAVQQLAAGLRGTATQLVGAIFELIADIEADAPATVDQANRLLAARDVARPNPNQIAALVARHYGVSQKLLKSNSRKQHVVRARATAVYLARELSAASYGQIGRLLGGRDHTTIMHNFRKVERELQVDCTLQETVDDLRRLLLSR